MRTAEKLNGSFSAHFVKTLASNVDNKKLTDAQFREFVRNCMSNFQEGTPGALDPVEEESRKALAYALRNSELIVRRDIIGRTAYVATLKRAADYLDRF